MSFKVSGGLEFRVWGLTYLLHAGKRRWRRDRECSRSRGGASHAAWREARPEGQPGVGQAVCQEETQSTKA